MYLFFRISMESAARGYKYRMLIRIHKLLARNVINSRTMGVMINDLEDARTPADLRLLDAAINQIELRQEDHAL
jgi:hypothetical protein